jgi:hypothetical protein
MRPRRCRPGQDANALKNTSPRNGGGRGIRTPDTLSGTAVFKTAAINHSAIPPYGMTLIVLDCADTVIRRFRRFTQISSGVTHDAMRHPRPVAPPRERSERAHRPSVSEAAPERGPPLSEARAPGAARERRPSE